MNQNAEALKRNFLELTELKHILRKTQVFFDEVSDRFQIYDALVTNVVRFYIPREKEMRSRVY